MNPPRSGVNGRLGLERDRDAMTRVYELIDVVRVPSGSRADWRTLDVTAALCEWSFEPRAGATGEGRPSTLCGPGRAMVVEGSGRTLRAAMKQPIEQRIRYVR